MPAAEDTMQRLVIGWFSVQLKSKREGLFAQLKYGRFLVAELPVTLTRRKVDVDVPVTDPADSDQYQELLKRAFGYVQRKWRPKAVESNPDFAQEKLSQPELPENAESPDEDVSEDQQLG